MLHVDRLVYARDRGRTLCLHPVGSALSFGKYPLFAKYSWAVRIQNKAVSTLRSLKSGVGRDINKHEIAAQVRGMTINVCTRCHGIPKALPPRKPRLRHDWSAKLLGSA